MGVYIFLTFSTFSTFSSLLKPGARIGTTTFAGDEALPFRAGGFPKSNDILLHESY